MFNHAPDATPIDADEAEGLIPAHITTQRELNEWEQMNILDAEKWMSRQHFHINDIANINFIKKLHQTMFSKTWRWSGKFRQSNKNIGVDWIIVPVALKILVNDLQFQLDYQTYPVDEIAVRFHHRLVAIHPFVNGNGRHARLMADIILLSQNKKRFAWGRADHLAKPTTVRREYIAALRAADQMDYSPLIRFVRS